jgi:hypothetical protein
MDSCSTLLYLPSSSSYGGGEDAKRLLRNPCGEIGGGGGGGGGSGPTIVVLPRPREHSPSGIANDDDDDDDDDERKATKRGASPIQTMRPSPTREEGGRG